CIEPGRCDDSRLPHRAAEEVLLPPRALHQRARARQDGAQRTTETLRETDRDRVELLRDPGRVDTLRDRSVEQPPAVEVNGETDLASGGDDGSELVERPHATTGAVVRVLERQ